MFNMGSARGPFGGVVLTTWPSESNTDYYVRNSEKLKARSRSVYKADPSKKKAAAAALYKL